MSICSYGRIILIEQQGLLFSLQPSLSPQFYFRRHRFTGTIDRTILKSLLSPWPVSSMLRASACALKSLGLGSWSGAQVPSLAPIKAHVGGNQSMPPPPFCSPPSFLLYKISGKNILVRINQKKSLLSFLMFQYELLMCMRSGFSIVLLFKQLLIEHLLCESHCYR